MLSGEIEPRPEDSFEDSCMPPVRFLGLQSFMCHSSRRLLGYLQRREETCFQNQRDFSSNRPPAISRRVDSLMSSVLFGVPSPILPATPFEAANPARISSLFATSPEPSTKHGSTPSSALFRPQAFSTSRRLAPSPVSWASSIPRPRAGFLEPFRGFSRFAAALTHHQVVPPCCYRTNHSLTSQLPRSVQTNYEALLHESKRSSKVGVNLPFPSLPSSASSSSRRCASTVSPVTRAIRSCRLCQDLPHSELRG